MSVFEIVLISYGRMMFPIEIWEKIFSYVDTKDLVGFKMICKSWHTLIERVLKENNHWHKMLIKDVPSSEWASLFEKLYPDKRPDSFQCTDKKSEIWMNMYRLWLTCEKLTKCRTETELIDVLPPRRQITCASTMLNTLAIGTAEGQIYFYKLNNLIRPPIYVADHNEHVCDIKFLRNEKRLIAVTLSINYHIKFWDLKLKILLYTTRGKLICTSYNNCYSVMNNVLSVQGSVPKTQYSFFMHDDDYDADFIAIAVGSNMVSLYSACGDFVTWNKELQQEDFMSMHIPLPLWNVCRCYIFKMNIAVCITELGFLGFSVAGGEWKVHNIFAIFHGIPTAILIYASLVIIGLDSGNVLIFHVKDIDTLDFGTAECKTITLDMMPIESLEIIQCLGTVRLLATSVNTVYIVNFL